MPHKSSSEIASDIRALPDDTLISIAYAAQQYKILMASMSAPSAQVPPYAAECVGGIH